MRQAGYLNGDKQFIRTLNAELAKYPRGKRKVFVFIHGYNTMFAEGLYRFTQVVHDSGSTAVPVLFTWASRGALTEYVYDNNSATTARDDLEHTFRLLFASDADQINILANSMGNWVTVEALRQIKIAGGLPQIDKLGLIFLAAPDIDIDVFKSQMRRFGKPRKPFYIVLSKDDQALRASNFIAGDEGRLGADGNTAELTALGAVVIDLTDIKATDSSNHSKFAARRNCTAVEFRTGEGRGLESRLDLAAARSSRHYPRGSGRIADHDRRRSRQDHNRAMTSIHFRFATVCHGAAGWHGFPKSVVAFIEVRFRAPLAAPMPAWPIPEVHS